jgi:hypothetical protein
MRKRLLYFLLTVFIGCEAEINQPQIQKTEVDYTYVEYKYGKYQDSILEVKSEKKLFHLEVLNESNNWVAHWTDMVPMAYFDSNSDQIENLLNGKEYTKGFTAKFILDKNGNIDSLGNWNSLKEHVDSLTLLYYQGKGMEEEEIEEFKPFVELFQTKANILNGIYKGILAYHSFYGIEVCFDDTLMVRNSILAFEESCQFSEAKIREIYQDERLVDYQVSIDYDSVYAISGIIGNEILPAEDSKALSSLKNLNLKDTIYYRFNKEEQLIENVILKRLALIDTFQVIHEIRLARKYITD